LVTGTNDRAGATDGTDAPRRADTPRVGVLALQGDFREHRLTLERLGAEVVEVRLPRQLDGLAGLIIPGGESTTMAKLMAAYGFDEAITGFVGAGGALWGTCAGAIAVATDIVGKDAQPRLGLLDISVDRNAYGRQVASFEADLTVAGLSGTVRVLFIRAPRIVRVGEGVEVLSRWEGEPVLVRSGRVMAGVFHPELGGDDRVHQLFLEGLPRSREPAPAS
jgi:5'-phosphate synthase pdxT subunit